MKHRLFSGLLVLVAAACNGPMGLLPGGKLAGKPGAAPENWNFAGDSGTVQLETRPGDPYSVNVAYTIIDGRLYINAGDTETAWVKNIAADPDVLLRMNDVLYELKARRLTDRAEIEQFGKAWTDQSVFFRDPADLGEVWIYQLVPR